MFQRVLRAAAKAAITQTSRVNQPVLTTCARTLIHANPPDLMKEKIPWKREAIDEEPLPDPDLDERRSDNESEYEEFDDQEINSILDDEYVEPEIIGKFKKFMRLAYSCKPIEFHPKYQIDIHPTLKKATRAFFDQCETAEHYDGLIEASGRCYDFDYHLETIEACRTKGHVITDLHYQPLITIAKYQISRKLFERALEKLGDRSTWAKSTHFIVIDYHEAMGDFDIADEMFAAMVESGMLYEPWRPVFRAHKHAIKEAFTVPTWSPMYDPKSPMADVVQLDNLPYHQVRVHLRYAIYSMQGKVNPKFPNIRVPHNLVIQAVRHSEHGGNLHYKKWVPAKNSIKDYLQSFGITAGNIDFAGPLCFVDKKDFSKLPTEEMIKEMSKKRHQNIY